MKQPTRVYQNHHLDSTRWEGFVHRPGDIIISTSYKAGTTWTQRIVSLLVLGPGPLPPGGLNNVSPWIDARFFEPAEPMYARLEAQEHRRFVKSHLAFDAIPYWDDVRYICVGRDTRDVFMVRSHFGPLRHLEAHEVCMHVHHADEVDVGSPRIDLGVAATCPTSPTTAARSSAVM